MTRTGVISSGADAPPDNCSGRFAMEFNPLAAADAAIVSGTTVYAQFWYRDPAASFGTGLTDALRFLVGP